MKRNDVLLRAGLAAVAGGLVSVAAAAPVAETLRIGSSRDGRAVEVVAVGEPGADALGRTRDDRPALLIVAGMQGHHTIGTDVARALVDRLLDSDAMNGRTVYVIAVGNPDGAGRYADGSQARAEWGRAPGVLDFDGDGRTNEDGAEDLNGDGLVTLMRVPAPNTRFGLEATHVIDPDDGRLMREPVAKDGEIATHALLVEGIDNDFDGAFNEDGWGGSVLGGSGGGVDFDMHWPTFWPEHEDGAGLYPLARPAARAITEWVQSRGNIVGVVVYGPHDTLSKPPAAGKFGPVGEVSTGIEKADAEAYGIVSEMFKEATGITKPAGDADRSGSFLQWAYADLGVYAFGTPVWVRPDLVKGEKDEKSAEAETAEEAPADPQAAAMALAVERDRASMAERGVPADLIEFIYMTDDERAEQMVAYEQAGPEALAEVMATIRRLPMDVQQRLMALGQGQADPHPAEVTPEDLAAVGSDGTPGAKKPKKKPGDSPDAKWLAWMEEAGVGGFVEWAPFNHPDLGPVEIGGFVPGARVNPPAELVDGLVDQQAEFVSGLLGVLPDLEVDEPVVERVGDGLWRVSVEARNTGRLATVPASGTKARRLPGLVMVLDPGQTFGSDAIVSGSRVARFASVGGNGERVRAEWLIAGRGRLKIEVRSPRFGGRVFDVRLVEGGGR